MTTFSNVRYVYTTGRKPADLLAVLLDLVDGGSPDGKNETDLVDEIGNVVDAVGPGIGHGAEEVT